MKKVQKLILLAAISSVCMGGLAACSKKTPVVSPSCEHDNIKHIDRIDSTCVSEGTEEYWQCLDCSQKFSDGEGVTQITDVPIIGKKPHTLGDPTEAVDATCIRQGNIEYWTCSVCDNHFSDAEAKHLVEDIKTPVDPSAHKLGTTQTGSPATCAEDGVPEHKDCELCFKHFTADGVEITADDYVIDALGHNYTALKITAQPNKLEYNAGDTFNPAGMSVAVTCSRCGDTSVTDYKIEGGELTEKGAKKVTVKYGDVSAEIDVTVYKNNEFTGSACDFEVAQEQQTYTAPLADGITGNVVKLVCGGDTFAQGITQSGKNLTLAKSIVDTLLGEKKYGDVTVTLYTDTYEKYITSLSLVTKKIAQVSDLMALTSANTASVIDGYYIVTQDIDASSAGTVRLVNNDTENDDTVGFKGIFDGRGHVVSNVHTSAKYNALGGVFGQLLKGSIVRNVAFTNMYGSDMKRLLVGESRKVYGTIENVLVTTADSGEIYLDGNNEPQTRNGAKAIGSFAGDGSIRNFIAIGVESINGVRGDGVNFNQTTVSNIMSVTKNSVCGFGGFAWSDDQSYNSQPNYATVTDMFAALDSDNRLTEWGSLFSYKNDTLFFGETAVLTKQSEREYVAANLNLTASVTDIIEAGTVEVKADRAGISFSLKSGAPSFVTVTPNGILTVNEFTGSGEFTVIATHRSGATKELLLTYSQTVVVPGYFADIEKTSTSPAMDLSKLDNCGTVQKLIIGTTELSTGFTQNGNTLSLEQSTVNAILGGKEYGDFDVVIVTDANRYMVKVSIVTKIINSANVGDFWSNKGVPTADNVTDGYYILGEDISDKTFNALYTWNGGNGNGFAGIFDGRGHKISNSTFSASMFGYVTATGVVRNIALVNVTSSDGGILGLECTGGTYENVFISTSGRYPFMSMNPFGQTTFKNFVFITDYSGSDTSGLFNEGNTDNGGNFKIDNALLISNKTDGYKFFGGSPVESGKTIYASSEAMWTGLATDNKLASWQNSLITYADDRLLFGSAPVAVKTIAIDGECGYIQNIVYAETGTFDITMPAQVSQDNLSGVKADGADVMNAVDNGVLKLPRTILGERKYGDIELVFETNSGAYYSAKIAIITKVITSANVGDFWSNKGAPTAENVTDGYYILGEDISDKTFNALYTWNGGNGNGFTGIFDGRGHKISNSTFNASMFGYVTATGVVRNIALVNVTSGDGGILGFECTGGTYENVFISTSGRYPFISMNPFGQTTFKNFVFITDYSGSDTSGLFDEGNTNNGGNFKINNALLISNKTDGYKYFGGSPVESGKTVYGSTADMWTGLATDNKLASWQNSLITYANGAIMFNGSEVAKASV